MVSWLEVVEVVEVVEVLEVVEVGEVGEVGEVVEVGEVGAGWRPGTVTHDPFESLAGYSLKIKHSVIF